MTVPGRLVGRTAELRRLTALACGDPGPGDGAGAEGSPGGAFALVVGEPGMGKSSLVNATAAAARRSGVAVVRGVADAGDRAGLALWRAPLRAFAGPGADHDPTVPSEERRWDVLDVLVSALAGGGPEPGGPVHPTHQARPVLLVLEDLHWADDDALWVLERLVPEVAGAPVTIVGTTRPAPADPAVAARRRAVHRLADTVLELGGLSRDETAELVSGLAADAGSPAGTTGGADALAGATGGDGPDGLAALHARTGGNPLFVQELWRTPAGGLPAEVGHVLAPTIDALGPEVAATVAGLALAGVDAPVPVLAAATGLAPDTLDEHLGRAVELGVLVREAAGGLAFRHSLLAEAALERVPTARRRDCHRALADAWSALVDAGAADRTAAAVEAAHHRLAAVPAVDAAGAAEAALAAADGQRAAGDDGGAARLLADAAAVLARYPAGPPTLRARALLAEGEARRAAGDHERVAPACAEAARLAEAAGDRVLQAAAETAAVASHNPFLPDPVVQARLAELDEQVPGIDPAVRARLRGRRAVLAAATPAGVAEAHRLADSAVALARELDDPALIVDALRDRHFVAVTPADLEAKAAAAEEVVALAARAGRPDLVLMGREWRTGALLRRGDLRGALGALVEMETLAGLMPSPAWRYVAAVRRSGVLAITGDVDGALDLAITCGELGRRAVPALEVQGVEVGVRFTAQRLYGRPPDDRLARSHRDQVAAMGQAPNPFIQVHFAVIDLALGDVAAARRRIGPWAGRPDLAVKGMQSVSTLTMLATCLVTLGWREPAPGLRAALAPYAGTFPVDNAIGADLPVDGHLAALALLTDDPDAAVTHARASLAFARRMPSPPLEARSLELLAAAQARRGDHAAATAALDAAQAIAEPLGLVLDPPSGDLPVSGTRVVPAPVHRSAAIPTTPAPGAPVAPAGEAPGGAAPASLRLAGGTWHVASPHGTGTVPDMTGLAQLARVLGTPGVAHPAVELAALAAPALAAGTVPVAADLGPALDGRAKREYRRRIVELRSEIDEADDHHDLARASKLRAELDALLAELRRAVGLGGRDRPQGSGNERARINTTRNVRRAIAAIGRAVPGLGAHLDASVRTGHACTYAPEPSTLLTWTVTRGDDPGP